MILQVDSDLIEASLGFVVDTRRTHGIVGKADGAECLGMRRGRHIGRRNRHAGVGGCGLALVVLNITCDVDGTGWRPGRGVLRSLAAAADGAGAC